MSQKFQKRCEARQSKIRAGRVLTHATKRIAAITPNRALAVYAVARMGEGCMVLRFLLNPNPKTYVYRPFLSIL